MQQPIAIVTGANHGIGLEIARGLVQEGYHVILAVRDTAKGEAAARAIGGSTEVLPLDLADHAIVRTFAQAVLARHPAIALLVNNAGIHTARHALTRDGFESTFATNHLGHFLLTSLLLDALKRGAPSRIVNVASEAHRGARTNDFTHAQEWSGFRAYTTSKLANIMFTQALARRLEGSGVTVNAAHPGSVRTGWARGGDSGPFRFVVAAVSPFLLSPAAGARTPLHVATAPELAGVSGRYFARMKERTPAALARDVDAQERLWTLSERLAKV